MKTKFIKPKEKILEDLADPIRESVLSAINPIISNAMTMYSDQKNNGLKKRADELAIELHETMVKHDELFDEAERLTKEVEELKLRLSGKTFFNPFEEENTRLRELLAMAKQIIINGCVDPNPFLDSIDNALNHKP